jgi:amino acid adenylation domain-containing protein
MQLGGSEAIPEFELSSNVIESLVGPRVDSRTALSCGVLLEWLIAIRAVDVSDSALGDTRVAIRLGRLNWCEPAELAADARVLCRVRHGIALIASGSFDAAQLLVSAEFAADEGESDAQARIALERADVVKLSERIEAGEGFIVGPHVFDAALGLALQCAEREMDGSAALARLRVWPAIGRAIAFTNAGPAHAVQVRVRARDDDGSVQLDVSVLDSLGFELARLERVAFGNIATVEARTRSQLARIFEIAVRECLPTPPLDVHAPLTALGATSIDLVRIGSHLHDWLGWAPSLSDFLADPTLASLVSLYVRAKASPEARVELREGALSPTERQLWFLEQVTNAAGAYNEAVAWRIRGALSIDALERALRVVQRRHPALHSYFPSHEGSPRRQLDWRECELELIETTAVRGAAGSIERCIETHVGRPFDLLRTPPFRCVLLLHAAGDATLVLVAHHIVCDAWSLTQILAPELGEAYAATLADSGSGPESDVRRELAPVPPTAEYERAGAAHFQRKLRGLPELLDFPFDRPRPAQQTHAGACVRRPLPAARWGALKALARALEQSPFVVGLAAYEVLLHRYARTREFCVGVPVSLRRAGADLNAFGCWVNLTVVRAGVDPDQSFRAHCNRVRAEVIDALRFDQLALGDIVRAVAPARSLSHTPLVQAVFGYRERVGSALELEGVEVTPVQVHNGRAKFDLTLAIDDFGERAELSLEYASDLLEESRAAQLLEHFDALLEEIERQPDARVAALQLAGRYERQRLAAFEKGAARSRTLRAFGYAHLAARPADACVLRTGTRAWTAAEVIELASQIMRELRERGVEPGEYVGLCVPRSAEWVAAVLAIVEIGAAYVPLDPKLPAARIQSAITTSRANVAITSGALLSDTDVHVIDVRNFDAASSVRSEVASIAVALEASPSRDMSRQPLYAIMTSGSTGTPRLAAVTRAGFSNLLDWYLDDLQLTTSDRVLFATSVGFDLSQKNLFAALAAGAELVIDDFDTFDPERLCDVIASAGVTVLNCAPSLAYALVAAAAERDVWKLRSIRVLVLGGEPIDFALLSAWTSHPSFAARIVNSYGPTECCDVVTARTVASPNSHAPAAAGGNNLGRPIPNARCRVVDLSGDLAATGVPGELWLAGTPVGLGYLGDGATTSAKFVREHGTRWYRTGDLVRWNERGELLFLGRIDAQVKVRGYRIELAEIEAALKAQPEVLDAIVTCEPDGRGRSSLTAHVVPALAAGAGESSSRAPRTVASSVRSRLATVLPSYMIPQRFLVIDRVPRTTSGKPDRNALATQAPDPVTPATASTDRPGLARTHEKSRPLAYSPQYAGAPAPPDVLTRVTRAWCAVLGVLQLPSDANFFESGGHSLAAIELTAQLELDLGVRLRVASIFERPVLRDYAAHLADLVDRLPDSCGQGEPTHAPLRLLPAG